MGGLGGFQVTFFRSHGCHTNHAVSVAAKQLLFATQPLPILQGKSCCTTSVARAGFGVAEASEADTAVDCDWSLLRRTPGPGADATANPLYRTDHG